VNGKGMLDELICPREERKLRIKSERIITKRKNVNEKYQAGGR
jgi:hypothetical protein